MGGRQQGRKIIFYSLSQYLLLFFYTTHRFPSLAGGGLGGLGPIASSGTLVQGDSGANDEKDVTLQELRETVLIMSEKIKKLEQLVRIKDAKIETLHNKLRQYAE